MEEYMDQKLNFEIHNGYLPVSIQENESLFYSLITKQGETLENMSKNTPIMFWLEGGPGASGQFELYYELGPFNLKKNNGKYEITLKEISWNSEIVLVILDQPLNVGFSYSQHTRVKSTKQATQFFKVFLQNFYKRYEHLTQNPTYIFGQSFGGHYVPAMAYMVLKEKPVENLNFKGIGIGDGLIDYKIQTQQYGNYGESVGIFSNRQKQYCDTLQNYSTKLVDLGQYHKAVDVYQVLCSLPGDSDIYNIFYYSKLAGQEDPNYNFELYVELMNDQYFRKNVYGIPDFIPKFEFVNIDVYNDMWDDIPVSYKGELEYLLNSGIQVLLWEGQLDYIINSPGYQDLASQLEWKFSQQWFNAERDVWYKYGSDRFVLGNYQQFENFVYVNVYKAGHVGFADQPQAGIQMLQKYIDWDW